MLLSIITTISISGVSLTNAKEILLLAAPEPNELLEERLEILSEATKYINGRDRLIMDCFTDAVPDSVFEFDAVEFRRHLVNLYNEYQLFTEDLLKAWRPRMIELAHKRMRATYNGGKE